MRLTIERMRTLVLLGGALLLVALVAFLAVARWKSNFILREIPKRLGANIQQESNGVTYTQAHGGHTLFKIHASKVVQLKEGGRAILHDVQIELYGEDGARVDRISGDEFEYDQKDGVANASGPVEITLMRPGETPAVAHRAIPGHPAKPTPLTSAAEKASQGEIHVKTSGLTFDQKSGVAVTSQKVEFAITQGSGSSLGALFDSGNGRLVLDRAVELNVKRGSERVVMHAQHAEFERDNLVCHMQGAQGEFRGGQATAGKADLLFRPDGSAIRLDATDGFSLTSSTSSHLAAPRGTLEFDDHNQPQRGRMEGGATFESSNNGRQLSGTAPTADFAFTAQGLLSHTHLGRGVTIHSEQTSTAAQSGEAVRILRDWRSPVADADFRTAGKGQVELSSVIGTGGVVISSQAQRGTGAVLPSRMGADQVTATFGAQEVLTNAVGTGHAMLEQITASGAKQTTTGDCIEAAFASLSARTAGDQAKSPSVSEQIQSAVVDGHVVLVQQPPAREHTPASGDAGSAKPGAPAPSPLRATAGRAVYEGAGEWLHLLIQPRIESDALQLSADKVDVSQSSGDAFAHGNVKATWLGGAPQPADNGKAPPFALGGREPAHVIAAEAQLHQATGEASFQGKARLWQQANSISAPVILLDRSRQILLAHGSGAADPVRVVMLSAGGAGAGGKKPPGRTSPSTKDLESMGHAPPAEPSLIRVRGGDLKYSEAERRAVMHGSPGASIVADTGAATVVSNELELVLLPPGNHAGAEGQAAQIDRVTATGHVAVSSQGRRGVGEKLVYSSETDEYVLTGTPAHPPTLTDPAKGTVRGASLIFNTRDDSVSIEGGAGKTLTETIAPK